MESQSIKSKIFCSVFLNAYSMLSSSGLKVKDQNTAYCQGLCRCGLLESLASCQVCLCGWCIIPWYLCTKLLLEPWFWKRYMDLDMWCVEFLNIPPRLDFTAQTNQLANVTIRSAISENLSLQIFSAILRQVHEKMDKFLLGTIPSTHAAWPWVRIASAIGLFVLYTALFSEYAKYVLWGFRARRIQRWWFQASWMRRLRNIVECREIQNAGSANIFYDPRMDTPSNTFKKSKLLPSFHL